ncbi:MAG: hypothetical protein Q9220_004684 [cf. Caloplaca sp. 1 TL-2023]
MDGVPPRQAVDLTSIVSLRALKRTDASSQSSGPMQYENVGGSIVGILRFFPLCIAAPVPPLPPSNRAVQPVKQSSSDTCMDNASTNLTISCWSELHMNDYLANWTTKTVISNPPAAGTMFCRPAEPWAQCFIRFTYGQQQKAGAPMDCSTASSTTCKAPSDMLIKPTSAQGYYGAYAVHAIFTYIDNLTSALLSATAHPGALQYAYTSANAGAGASAEPNPVDATIFQLLFENGFSDQDTAFGSLMRKQPYTGNFTGATTDPPSDAVLYQGMVAVLQQRLQKIMGTWETFEVMLGSGFMWTQKIQEADAFVSQWTAGLTPAVTSPSGASIATA